MNNYLKLTKNQQMLLVFNNWLLHTLKDESISRSYFKEFENFIEIVRAKKLEYEN